jgi:hypothetical protein
MQFIKKIGACLAVTALLGVAASPASANRYPEVPGESGRPGLTGDGKTHIVVHCQRAMELLLGVEAPQATYPGVVIFYPDGSFREASSVHCPLLAA